MTKSFNEVKALKKNFIFVMTLSLLLIIVFFITAFFWMEWRIHKQIEEQAQEQLIMDVNHLLHRGKQKLEFFIRHQSKNPAVMEAIEKGDSEALLTLIYAHWNLLQERNPYLNQMNVILADGRRLLHVHKPGEPCPVETGKNGSPLASADYKVCDSSSAYSMSVPIVNARGTHLGEMQFLFEASFFMDGIKELTGFESAIFVNEAMCAPLGNDLPKVRFSDYILQASSDKSLLEHFNHLPDDYRLPKTYNYHDGETLYDLLAFDIGTLGYEPVAKIVVFQDVTDVLKQTLKNFGLVSILFIAVIFVIILMLRNYISRALEKIIAAQSRYIDKIIENDIKLKENETYLNTIFNASPDMIITTYGNKVDRANAVMLEFTGHDTLEAFREKYDCICNLFEKESGYLYREIDGMFWLDYIYAHPEHLHLAKMKKDAKEYTFVVKAQRLVHDEKRRSVVVLSDITELEDVYRVQSDLEREMIDNYEKTLISLVDLVEKRDTYTGGHSQRVAEYSRLLAEELGCSKNECDLLYRAGILHDVGKMTTPDSVLLKPGRLNQLEYKLIQNHVAVGHDMLMKIPMYHELADIIKYHHERYDGKGYPEGISGNDIPYLARIMIVADAFDAMTTSRIYKARKTVHEALEELKELSTVQFHPEVVEAAQQVFSTVEIEKSITQLPQNEIEEERFAYFYKDSVTQVYNRSYLDYLLNENLNKPKYAFLSMVLLHNFSLYNEEHGWDAGDAMLLQFAQCLTHHFPDASIFRVYGDDFVVLHKTYKAVDTEILNNEPFVKENGLSVSVKGIDLIKTPLSEFKAEGKTVI